jgi:hypothetical protein
MQSSGPYAGMTCPLPGFWVGFNTCTLLDASDISCLFFQCWHCAGQSVSYTVSIRGGPKCACDYVLHTNTHVRLDRDPWTCKAEKDGRWNPLVIAYG